jgi:MFS transporter, AAHS family, 4-hydroxybenzoate transporter
MQMNGAGTTDVRALIDEGRLGPLQIVLLALGFAVMVFDGCDVVVTSFLAPQLKVEWHSSAPALGAMLSAALIGQALGALAAGFAADRFGRKLVVVGSVCWFGALTLVTAAAPNLLTMQALRFITGLGLGAAVPNMVTLISEYSPARSKSFLINLATCGFTVGAAGGGFISAWLIPALGWRSVLVVVGAAPIVGGVALALLAPESIDYLLLHGGSQARIHAIVRRLTGRAPGEGETIVSSHAVEASASPLSILFSARYRAGTLALWACYFTTLFAVYLLSSWLPTLVRRSGGLTVADAAVVAAMFQVGGPVGTLVIGWTMDRLPKSRVLCAALVTGALALFGLANCGGAVALFSGVALVAGACLNGTAVGLNARAAWYYPAAARASGISTMTFSGRVGATLSALMGGGLLSLGWSSSAMFEALIVPVLAGAGAIILLGRDEGDSSRRHAERSELGMARAGARTGGLSESL